jgi:hypothetical protein
MEFAAAVEEQHEDSPCCNAHQGINERFFSYFDNFGERPGARVQPRIVRLGVGSAADPLLVAARHAGHPGGGQKKDGHGETNNGDRQKNIADSKVHLRVTKGDKMQTWRTRAEYH